MIKSVVQFLRDALIYGSVATVLALLLSSGYLWMRFGADKEKVFRVMTAVYNVDTSEMEAQQAIAEQRGAHEELAYEEVLNERANRSLDQDLRQQAIGNGLADLRLLQRDLIEERRRYDLLKNAFDAELKNLKSVAKDNAIVELQLTLESIKPRQAKEQLVRMLPEAFGQTDFSELPEEDRKTIIDVVAILKAMPIDKRKKLLAEFKTEEEARQLAELLRLIRLGVPEVKLIDETRNRLQEFNAN